MAKHERPQHVLIIGAGVFGLATTLSLLHREEYKKTHITVIDAAEHLPNLHGSSVDASRIVRADYERAEYARLAGRAPMMPRCYWIPYESKY